LTAEPRLSWTEVRDTIRARILARHYAPGDKLPRDEDLARNLGCARADIPVTRREVEARGSLYGYRLISRAIAESPPAVMARFGLQDPSPMLHVRALHLADRRPYILEDRWIDLATTPEILEVDLAQHSANEWLVHHKPYSRVDVRFHAVNAEGEIARHLDTPRGSALLVLERTTWIGSAPITTVQSVAAPGYEVAAQS
jgi:GntR family histidine utilization transcriptional repressor